MTAASDDSPSNRSAFVAFWIDLVREIGNVLRVRGTLLFLLLWIPLIIGLYVVNYTWTPTETFEDAELNSYAGQLWTVPAFLLFYAVPYLSTAFLYSLCTGRWRCWKDHGFWLRLGFILLILGLRGGFRMHLRAVTALTPEPMQQYIDNVGFNFLNATCSFALIAIFWAVFERKQRRELNGIYGLSRHGFKASPYLIMLAGMVPLVFVASFRADFLEAYPRFGSPYDQGALDGAAAVTGLSDGSLLAGFQIAYGLDFVLVELIFRGFLVIGLMRYFREESDGYGVIWPMVATYGILHFGKPWGEAVSSLFGGFALGVIAYSSRNVWGGVFVHIGIALMMEWFALWQWRG